LYKNRVIHRDVKPKNILIVTKDGKPLFKLADMGLSKVLDKTDDQAQT
jgi:serine/threonine protein kinase